MVPAAVAEFGAALRCAAPGLRADDELALATVDETVGDLGRGVRRRRRRRRGQKRGVEASIAKLNEVIAGLAKAGAEFDVVRLVLEGCRRVR